MGFVRFLAFLTFSSLAFAAESDYGTRESFAGGKFNVSWKYDQPRDTVMFRVEVQTAGWIGMGFTKTNQGMNDLDLVVGGRTGDSKNYLYDMYSTSKVIPPEDAKQNYNLTKAEETGGKTTLWFERKVNTGDDKDLMFKANDPVYLAYAFHNTDDAADPTSFPQHSTQGHSAKKYDLLLQSTPSPSAPGSNATTLPPTDGATDAPTPTAGQNAVVSSFRVAVLAVLLVIL